MPDIRALSECADSLYFTHVSEDDLCSITDSMPATNSQDLPAFGNHILLALAFADIAAIALAATAVSGSQLVAAAVAFVLISGGALFTVWRFE